MKRTVFAIFPVLLPVIFTACAVETPPAQSGKSVFYGVIAEEKMYSNATLADKFAGDRVAVVLTNRESLKFLDYGPQDFSEVNAVRVVETTRLSTELVLKQLEAAKTGDTGKIKEHIEKNMLIDIGTFRRILVVYLLVDSRENVLEVVKILRDREELFFAGPDLYQEPSAVPNPLPMFWSVHKEAFDTIHMEQAWDIITGSDEMIAVMDTGIMVDHSFLAGRVDKELSRNFSTGDRYGMADPDSNGYYGVTDLNGHGTFVAGQLAATGPYNIGVCWDAKLVSLQIYDNVDSGQYDGRSY